MKQQHIALKTVNELRVNATDGACQFFVPAYQRGYRWSPLQVTLLLDDIRDFKRRSNPQPEEFYCLQPLVIKVRPNGEFEVVDGQQRLTTLLLILRHFNERLAKKYRQMLFQIRYETRPSLDDFLSQPDENVAEKNIDFFYLYQAIQAIEAWFARHDSEVEDIKSALLNKTKVIWFELADSDSPVDAFTRLNVGKIPLTNDELIRALFLRRAGSNNTQNARLQLHIAYEWDLLEKALQSDTFWYFLSNEKGKTQNRIGFLFDLVAQTEGMTMPTDRGGFATFYAFSEWLSAADADSELLWHKIKQTFLMLEEWYEDRQLYHMVGFLVSQNMPIKAMRQMSIDCSKSTFERRLRAEIFHRTMHANLPASDRSAIREVIDNRLEELYYHHSHTPIIRSILLLFNLATLLYDKRSNIRFQFDSFKRERWDIEHIRSVTDDKPERHHLRKAWLEQCRAYLISVDDSPKLQRDIEDFIQLTESEATHERFDALYEKVLKYFHEDINIEAEQGIANLTLLDEQTNRSYKNAVFAVKRQRLLTLDQAGIFVPLCTRNVFLKCYTPQVDNVMFWSQPDQDGYQQAIATVLEEFFMGNIEGGVQ